MSGRSMQVLYNDLRAFNLHRRSSFSSSGLQSGSIYRASLRGKSTPSGTDRPTTHLPGVRDAARPRDHSKQSREEYQDLTPITKLGKVTTLTISKAVKMTDCPR